MFKVRIVWNPKNEAVNQKSPYETFCKRVEVHQVIQKAMFAYPNDEIKTITITAAVSDALLDDQQSQDARGQKDKAHA